MISRMRLIIEAEAEAEAIALKGEAEAFAIEAKAKAEAEQMAKKADAWKEYKEAAMIDMMLQTLPKVRTIFILKTNNLTNVFLVRLLLRWRLRCPRPRRSRWWPVEKARWGRGDSPGRSWTS